MPPTQIHGSALRVVKLNPIAVSAIFVLKSGCIGRDKFGNNDILRPASDGGSGEKATNHRHPKQACLRSLHLAEPNRLRCAHNEMFPIRPGTALTFLKLG